MNLEEFKEHVKRQRLLNKLGNQINDEIRRIQNDQRNAPKDDTRERSDVEVNKSDESIHRDHKSRTCTSL